MNLVESVAKAYGEVLDTVTGVDLHDVSEDGLTADLNHRLGPKVGLFADASPETTDKNDCFHRYSLHGCGLVTAQTRQDHLALSVRTCQLTDIVIFDKQVIAISTPHRCTRERMQGRNRKR